MPVEFHRLSETRLKTWRKLQSPKYRKKMGLFLAEGEHAVEQILQNGVIEVEAIIAGEEWLASGKKLPAANVELLSATKEQITELSDTQTPQQLVAVCRIPALANPEEWVQPSDQPPLILALDGIQDPGNLGTILRSAAWFGVTGLLIGKGSVEIWNPKVVRSAVGGIAATAIAEGELRPVLGRFKELGCRVCTLELGEGAVSLSQLIQTLKDSAPDNQNRQNPLILVVGNEANGVSPEVSELSDVRVKIEGADAAVESLNAGVSASIALYELSQMG